MNAGNWFWIIYVIAFLFGGWLGYGIGDRRWVGIGFILFVLVGLVGWGVFGPPLR